MVRRKHPLEELLDDVDTLLRLVKGESSLVDLKLGEIHVTLDTCRIIVKSIERVSKPLAPLKKPDTSLVVIKARERRTVVFYFICFKSQKSKARSLLVIPYGVYSSYVLSFRYVL